MLLKPGKLLIASPKLLDENFYRSVVLLFQHDEEGAAGVVLNRVTNVSIGKVWETISSQPCPIEQMIHWGGPVQGPLMALHGRLMMAEIALLPKVLFSVDREHVVAIVEEAHSPLRLFSGYAGWGPQQLEGEIAEGSWYVVEVDDQFVFSDPESQWKRACESLGMQILFPGLLVKPQDPWLN